MKKWKMNPRWSYRVAELLWTYVFMDKQVRIGWWLFKRKIKRTIWKLRGKPSLEEELREAKKARAIREGRF